MSLCECSLQGVADGKLTVGDAVLFITLMQVRLELCPS